RVVVVVAVHAGQCPTRRQVLSNRDGAVVVAAEGLGRTVRQAEARATVTTGNRERERSRAATRRRLANGDVVHVLVVEYLVEVSALDGAVSNQSDLNTGGAD